MTRHRHQIHQLRARQPVEGGHEESVKLAAMELAKRQQRQRRQNDGKTFWDQIAEGASDIWDTITGKGNSNSNSNSKNAAVTTTSKTTSSKAAATTAKAATTVQKAATTTTPVAAKTTTSSSPTTKVGLPEAIQPTTDSTTDTDTATDLVVATDTPSSTSTTQSRAIAAATTPSSTEPSSTADASTANVTSSNSNSSGGDGGSSAATKAGIAFGVIGGVLIVFLIVWYIIRKRKQQMEHQRIEDDEKLNGPFKTSSAASSAPALMPLAASAVPVATQLARAPRLSLRPVTQFLPNLNRGDAAAAGGAAAGAAAAGAYPRSSPSAWERPMTGNSNNPSNPFGHNAERLDAPFDDGCPAIPVSPVSPVSPNSLATPGSSAFDLTAAPTPPPTGLNPAPATGVTGAVAGAAVGAVTGAVAVGALTRKASIRKDTPQPLDLTLQAPPQLGAIPPSPAGTEFSVNSIATGQAPAPSSSAAAIAAAGGPAVSTVHRVQLDFKPTMEDEMELKTGNLVRLLFEYDDGWALCIRLDRSQQGVVPRTCLSTRPVKPRAGPGGRPGPPVNPQGGRGPSPQGGRGPSPQGGRGPSPQFNHPHGGPGPQQRSMTGPGGYGPQQPRPVSPPSRPMTSNGPRSQSPAMMMPQPQQQQQPPQGPHGRSGSSSSISRKPIPGQAM